MNGRKQGLLRLSKINSIVRSMAGVGARFDYPTVLTNAKIYGNLSKTVDEICLKMVKSVRNPE